MGEAHGTLLRVKQLPFGQPDDAVPTGQQLGGLVLLAVEYARHAS